MPKKDVNSSHIKEQVIDTIAFIEAAFWIAGYDPTDFYPDQTPEEDEVQIAIEVDNPVEVHEEFPAPINPLKEIFKRSEFTIS